MSAIAGLFHLDGAPVDPGQVAGMSAALAHRGPDDAGAWCDGSTGLAHRMLHTTVESTQERQPLARAGLVLVADARIDNRDELCAMLGIHRRSEVTDAELILLAYQKWGRGCAEKLIGDFAFALWDEDPRVLYCARDPMGVKPFYYYKSDRLFAFASEVKTLIRLPEISCELDEEHVCSYLAGHFDEREKTFYKHIHRLPAAHTLVVTPLRTDRTPYWSLDPNREVHYATAEDYTEAFREIFVEAVRARTRSVVPIAATLSGGLDSSSIVSVAHGLRRGAEIPLLNPLSLVFPGLPDADLRLIDERGYVESVARSTGLKPHYVRGDLLSPLTDVRRVLWHLDEPYVAPNLYLHWALYGAAEQSGARVFLDGLDGDTTVSHGLDRLGALAEAAQWSTFEKEVHAYARHRGMKPTTVLRHFGFPQLAALARQGRWLGWFRAARALRRRFHLSRWQVALRGGLLPLVPARLLSVWRALRGRSGGETSILRRQLARRFSGHRRADRDDPSHPASGERASHWQGLTQPLYQLTLEMADKCAAAFAVEPRYPFFDRRLMEFCLAVPAELKFADGWGRLLLRRAMEGILPPDVQWRASKANLSPNFHRRLRAVDRPLVESADISVLGPYVNARSYRKVRRHYFASQNPGRSDPDGPLLFRATVLAIWLEKCCGNRKQDQHPDSASAAA